MKKNVLIIGGLSDIGISLIKKFSNLDYSIFFTSTDKKKEKLDELLINLKGKPLHHYPLDLKNMETFDDFGQNFISPKICFDDIIFCSGITDRTNFLDIKLETWNKVFTVNLTSQIFLLQKLFQLKLINYGGSIQFISSIYGKNPSGSSLSYAITKSGINTFVKNAVKIFAKELIRINAIAPGFVMTEWHKSKPLDQIIRIKNKIAVNRFAFPEEIVDLVLHVSKNKYINGQILTIDGGYDYQR